MAVVPPDALMNRKHRDPLAFDQLSHVHGIAMAESRCALEDSVAADSQWAGDDLLCAVGVHVRCHA